LVPEHRGRRAGAQQRLLGAQRARRGVAPADLLPQAEDLLPRTEEGGAPAPHPAHLLRERQPALHVGADRDDVGDGPDQRGQLPLAEVPVGGGGAVPQAAVEDPAGDEDIGRRVRRAQVQGIVDVIDAQEPDRLVAGAQHPLSLGQPTLTCAPAVSPSTGSPISSAIRLASSMRVSTIWDSGTVLMTSPLTKICPLPLPEATPRSASRASPGPLTTQPMTATRRGTVSPSSPAVTSSASL